MSPFFNEDQETFTKLIWAFFNSLCFIANLSPTWILQSSVGEVGGVCGDFYVHSVHVLNSLYAISNATAPF